MADVPQVHAELVPPRRLRREADLCDWKAVVRAALQNLDARPRRFGLDSGRADGHSDVAVCELSDCSVDDKIVWDDCADHDGDIRNGEVCVAQRLQRRLVHRADHKARSAIIQAVWPQRARGELFDGDSVGAVMFHVGWLVDDDEARGPEQDARLDGVERGGLSWSGQSGSEKSSPPLFAAVTGAAAAWLLLLFFAQALPLPDLLLLDLDFGPSRGTVAELA
eukprot:CAMPEP_0206819778 /NCGR_PEP_ID=MMETSP0975-20121206/11484_1 /ASSEMBLY_ACC=CAM_ASM_000399 /TAXON_ID=483370 /ORGANISM="non described non described, Strain CCMP2097" /LENGTH=221 /DNA_ID=CAMNT_0054362013 /DNA_START=133 /DNA_END=794 /DNA_ORIENTATION=+